MSNTAMVLLACAGYTAYAISVGVATGYVFVWLRSRPAKAQACRPTYWTPPRPPSINPEGGQHLPPDQRASYWLSRKHLRAAALALLRGIEAEDLEQVRDAINSARHFIDAAELALRRDTPKPPPKAP